MKIRCLHRAFLVALAVACRVVSFAAEAPPVAFVRLDEATAEIFESEPPSPVDYAAFLQQLRRHEPSKVCIVPLWQWSLVDPTQIRVLAKQVTELPIFLAAMLDNDAEDPNLADSLKSFPTGLRLEGDLTALPRFKSVSTLPTPALVSGPCVGFNYVDFGVDASVNEDGIRMPLVALGPNQEALPSLALLVTVEALGVDWEKVRITPGGSLQLGEDTQPIAIDRAGQVRIPLDEPADLVKIAAEQLIPSSEHEPIAKASPIQNSVVILGDDRESAQLFSLPSGKQISRAELIAWSVQTMLHDATTEPEPPPKPPPAVPYKFPDLRSANIGLWIIGVAWGTVFGFTLLQKRPNPNGGR